MSDIAHAIGTLKKSLEYLSRTPEQIDVETLTEISGETLRRLTSAQANLMRHFIGGNPIDRNNNPETETDTQATNTSTATQTTY